MRDSSRDLVEGIYTPGQAHLIGGSPGAGKSAWEIALERAVLNGEPFLGRATNAPPFWGVIVTDPNMEARREFWERAGVEPLPYYSLTEDAKLSPKSLYSLVESSRWATYDLLEARIKAFNPPPFSVITVDVGNFFFGDAMQGYDKSFTKGWAVSKLAYDMQITILILMHGGKQKKFDTYVRMIDRIIASNGFLGAVSTKSYIAGHEETGVGVGVQDFMWQSHYCQSETFRLRRTEAGFYELMEKLGMETQQQKPNGAERWPQYEAWFPPQGAINFLPTMTFLANAERLDISKRTAARDLEALEEMGLIVKYQGQRGRWQRRQEPKAEEVQ